MKKIYLGIIVFMSITVTSWAAMDSKLEIIGFSISKAMPFLKKYKIVDGNVGLLVYELKELKKWNEHIETTKEVEFFITNENGKDNRYIVRLKEREVAGSYCEKIGIYRAYEIKPRIFTKYPQ